MVTRPQSRLSRLLGLTLVLLFLGVQAAVAEFREVMVPMRDGIHLATNVSLPDGEGPWPAILSRTPYNKNGRSPRAADSDAPREQGRQYLDRGYAYVVQDVRGQFGSEGSYRAFVDDMEDGYDTVEWIAKQPWCNGKVGMVGASASGITANLAMMATPPHLAATYVTVAHGSSYRNSSFPGGTYLLAMVEDWSRGRGVEPAKVPRPITRPYGEADAQRDIRNYFSKITIPTYNVGGWYDIFLQGNIEAFVGLQNHGGEGARGNQKLLMGAFGHGRIQGDLKYPADAMPSGIEAQLRFFDHWMRGIDNGIDKEPAVRYFVMGDTFDESAPGNEWRTADNWPPHSTPTPYYLEPGGKLGLEPPGGSGAAKTAYVYDPNNPVPTVGGNNLTLPIGPMDQREVSGRADVIKFETAPLANPVEIVGQITAKLFVSTSAEDTDFFVKLIDVYPNGYEALVRDQGTRLRFREGTEKEVHSTPGEVHPLDVDLWSTALVFNKGHKIAIHVQSSNSRRFEPHSNTWAPVWDYETEAVKATNAVYHDAEHPSSVVLPVTKVYTSSAQTSSAGE